MGAGNKKGMREMEFGSALVLVLILVLCLIPILVSLAKISAIQTRAAFLTRVNQESRLNSERSIIKMIAFSAEEHKQDHYDPNINNSWDSNQRVNFWISSTTARQNHVLSIETCGPVNKLGHVANIHYVSNYLRFGFVSNGVVTIDNNSPLANRTYDGGMWITGDLIVDPTSALSFSGGSLVVGGDVVGNSRLSMAAGSRLLYGGGASGIVGAGTVHHFIPKDLNSVTPMGSLSDYYYRFATTTTVVNTTVTFQSDGSIQLDRGAMGVSTLAVPSGFPVVVVSSGAVLYLQGDVRRPYTIVSSAIGAGEGTIVVVGNLTYNNNPLQPATFNNTLAVLADRLVFLHQTPGASINASGFYYGRNAIQVESSTTVRGVVYSDNGVITTGSGQPLFINYDATLLRNTPRFLPEQPEVADFKLQKQNW